MHWLIWVALIVGGYLVGSIPSAYILVKLKNGVDIRRFGSGNVGTTNTVRAAGHAMGALVFIFDVAKGAIPTLIGLSISPELALVAGISAFAGHIWPIWLSFKGGKGVATGFGVALALQPLIALIVISTWLLISLITNYVSLGSSTAAALLPILAVGTRQNLMIIIVFAVMAVVIIWRHRKNFLNIRAGTEGKLFNRK